MPVVGVVTELRAQTGGIASLVFAWSRGVMPPSPLSRWEPHRFLTNRLNPSRRRRR